MIRIDFHHETLSTGEVHESSSMPFNSMRHMCLHAVVGKDWQLRQARWQRPQKCKRGRGGKL